MSSRKIRVALTLDQIKELTNACARLKAFEEYRAYNLPVVPNPALEAALKPLYMAWALNEKRDREETS